MVVSILISIYDYIRKHEYWVNKFRFCYLPRVAQIEVLRSMNYHGLLNMATASSKLRTIIKSIRIELPEFQAFVKGPWSCLQTDDSSFSDARCLLDRLIEKGEQLSYEELERDVKFVQNLFICKRFLMIIDWDEKEKEIDIMNNQYLLYLLQNCDTLVLLNGEIKSEEFEYVLKTLKAKAFLETWKMIIPIDFQSENAFRLDEVRYEDSRWVKLENLFTLKGLPYITLLSPTFNVSDFNRILKNWKTNENDMFRFLVIDIADRLTTEELFDGLTVVKHVRLGGDFYFLISAPKTEKSREILCVWFSTKTIILSSLSPGQRFVAFDDDEPFSTAREEYEILKILEKKEELEEKLKIGDVEELLKIRMELDEINENLKKDGVVFLDGIYVM